MTVTEKTNAMRMLESAGIEYQLRTYPLEEIDFSAERVAELLSMAPEQIFKTLIMIGDRSGPILVLAPAGTEVDMRALATVSGNKSVEMAPQRDVLELTGYVRGSVTPIGVRRKYPIYIEETAGIWEQIAISAGAKGMQLVLAPEDLVQFVSAQVVDIARSI